MPKAPPTAGLAPVEEMEPPPTAEASAAPAGAHHRAADSHSVQGTVGPRAHRCQLLHRLLRGGQTSVRPVWKARVVAKAVRTGASNLDGQTSRGVVLKGDVAIRVPALHRARAVQGAETPAGHQIEVDRQEDEVSGEPDAIEG